MKQTMKQTMSAIALMLIAITATAAEPHTAVPLWYGQDLQRMCDSDGKSVEHAMCWAYVSAVLEIVNNNSVYALKVCIQPWINPQRAVDVTTKWLHD